MRQGIYIIVTILTMLHPCNSFAKNGENASRGKLGLIYDSYKDEWKKTCDATDQNFLNDSASFRKSRLYDFCKRMPKGANLHVHGSAMIPTDMLIEFVAEHPSLKVNTKTGKDFGRIEYVADSTIQPSPGYMSMKEALASGISIKDIEDAWSLRGANGVRPWDWFNSLFRKMSELTYDTSIEEDYYTKSFEYYIKQGVTHVEPRLLFFGTHQEALEKARAVYRAQNKARQLNPDFSARIIFCGLKARTDSYNKSTYNKELFDNGIYISKNIKDTIDGGDDFVVGYDLVNEEDQSIPLAEFEDLIKDTKTSNPSLHITLHAGESTKTDNKEMASAIALGAERIGHGFNLYMHPALKHTIEQNDITLEVCPISNKTLGYCHDLRCHPAIGYIHEGINVTIGDDDPAYQMCSSLVDDMFVAAALWDLTLDEMKDMIRNSITASFLPQKRKKSLLRVWEKQWKDFQDETLKMHK